MTSADLRALLTQLGLPHTRVAHCLGVDIRTVRYWLAGKRAIPEPIARLVRAAAAGKINLADLEDSA